MQQLGKKFLFTFISVLFVQKVKCVSEPSFTTTSYPHVVTFSEGPATPGGTTIHTFTAVDDETGVIPFIDFVYEPTSSIAKFDLSESTTATERVVVFTLKANEEFDYETQDTYKIRATANDTHNSVTVLLTIQVEDVGETPYMNPNTSSQSFSIEENAVGTVIGSPSFTIEDADDLEGHTWSITGGNGTSYVSINTNNGTITLKVNYDRDDPSYAELIYVDVAVTDKYNLSVTKTYEITITDRNDNIPVCNPKVYSFDLDRNMTLGSTLATLMCTDADISAPNNEITYSFQTDDTNSQYFNISGSDITLTTVADLVYGEGPFTVYVLAVDGGSSALTGTATLSYTLPEATTLAPTTTNVPLPAYDALSSDNNLTLLLVAAAIVAACILGYMLVLCWRWHTFGQCMPKSCPDSKSCRNCCTCCPGDDIEKAMVVDSTSPSGFMTKKGMSLGPEAPKSRRHVGSLNTTKKGSSLGPEAPNSRRKSPMSIFS